MKTKNKIWLSLALVVLSTFFYEVIRKFAYLIGIQRELPSFLDIPLVGMYFPYYFFYVGILFMLAALVYLIYMWTSLEDYQWIVLQSKKEGMLQLKNTAIESYVRLIIQENKWLDNTKVKVYTKKDVIHVDISGDLRRTSGIVERTDTLIAQISTALQSFLSLEKSISTNITFRDTTPEKVEEVNKKRVV